MMPQPGIVGTLVSGTSRRNAVAVRRDVARATCNERARPVVARREGAVWPRVEHPTLADVAAPARHVAGIRAASASTAGGHDLGRGPGGRGCLRASRDHRVGRFTRPAWRVWVRHSLSRHARWCLLFNGTHLRLLDAGRTFARRHIDFDFESARRLRIGGPAAVILASATASGRPDDQTPSRRWRRSSRHRTRTASACARQAARRRAPGASSACLRRSSEAPAQPPARTALEALYEQALTAVYASCFSASRKPAASSPLAPRLPRRIHDQIAAHRGRGPVRAPGCGKPFQAMSRLAHQGCEAGDLHVTAFNGRLFAPGRTAARRLGAARRARA